MHMLSPDNPTRTHSDSGIDVHGRARVIPIRFCSIGISFLLFLPTVLHRVMSSS